MKTKTKVETFATYVDMERRIRELMWEANERNAFVSFFLVVDGKQKFELSYSISKGD